MHYHKYRLIIPFLLPAVFLYGLFVVYPYAQAIYYSLTSWRGVSANRPFVGLDNYERLWNDERFREALTRNGQLLVVLPLVTIAVALTFAALFSQGRQAVKGAGFYMVIFLAAMQTIPSSFYEAAILDGATRWTTFKDITFPLIWETVRTAVIYLAIIALDFFILVVVIAGGSTTTGAERAEVAAVYLYNRAFTNSQWGYASAIGVVLLLLTLLLSLVIMRLTRRETYEF